MLMSFGSMAMTILPPGFFDALPEEDGRSEAFFSPHPTKKADKTSMEEKRNLRSLDCMGSVFNRVRRQFQSCFSRAMQLIRGAQAAGLLCSAARRTRRSAYHAAMS